MSSKPTYVVIGAGFAGATIAERLAAAEREVFVIDRRAHIGGAAFDFYDEHGILVNRYGPHIFHTNAGHVVEYLSQFTKWRPYEHRVLSSVDGMLVPFPINLDTLNMLTGRKMDAGAASAYLFAQTEVFQREPKPEPFTAADHVRRMVGQELMLKLFQGYSKKQWGRPLEKLEWSVTARIPVRINRDARYFTDHYQQQPLHGFTKMFEAMLDRPRVHLILRTDWAEVRDRFAGARIVCTGPIDTFFNCRFGHLPFRTARFEMFHSPTFPAQPVGVVNYPNEYDFTRVTEFRHITGQRAEGSTLCYEYPADYSGGGGIPTYPVPDPEHKATLSRYDQLAEQTPGVYFAGRLGRYQYLNMDQVVAGSLKLVKRILAEEG